MTAIPAGSNSYSLIEEFYDEHIQKILREAFTRSASAFPEFIETNRGQKMMRDKHLWNIANQLFGDKLFPVTLPVPPVPTIITTAPVPPTPAVLTIPTTNVVSPVLTTPNPPLPINFPTTFLQWKTSTDPLTERVSGKAWVYSHVIKSHLHAFILRHYLPLESPKKGSTVNTLLIAFKEAHGLSIYTNWDEELYGPLFREWGFEVRSTNGHGRLINLLRK